jgi:hypothetical protein
MSWPLTKLLDETLTQTLECLTHYLQNYKNWIVYNNLIETTL